MIHSDTLHKAADLAQCDEDAADKLRALQILQGHSEAAVMQSCNMQPCAQSFSV